MASKSAISALLTSASAALPKEVRDVTGWSHISKDCTLNMPASASTERNRKIGKQLGKYCVAGGPRNVSCKNNSCVEGIFMHGFPKSEGNLRETWIKFVQKHRPNWQPSPYSALCSAHFEPRFYLQRPDIDVRQLDTNQSFREEK